MAGFGDRELKRLEQQAKSRRAAFDAEMKKINKRREKEARAALRAALKSERKSQKAAQKLAVQREKEARSQAENASDPLVRERLTKLAEVRQREKEQIELLGQEMRRAQRERLASESGSSRSWFARSLTVSGGSGPDTATPTVPTVPAEMPADATEGRWEWRSAGGESNAVEQLTTSDESTESADAPNSGMSPLEGSTSSPEHETEIVPSDDVIVAISRREAARARKAQEAERERAERAEAALAENLRRAEVAEKKLAERTARDEQRAAEILSKRAARNEARTPRFGRKRLNSSIGSQSGATAGATETPITDSPVADASMHHAPGPVTSSSAGTAISGIDERALRSLEKAAQAKTREAERRARREDAQAERERIKAEREEQQAAKDRIRKEELEERKAARQMELAEKAAQRETERQERDRLAEERRIQRDLELEAKRISAEEKAARKEAERLERQAREEQADLARREAKERSALEAAARAEEREASKLAAKIAADKLAVEKLAAEMAEREAKEAAKLAKKAEAERNEIEKRNAALAARAEREEREARNEEIKAQQRIALEEARRAAREAKRRARGRGTSSVRNQDNDAETPKRLSFLTGILGRRADEAADQVEANVGYSTDDEFIDEYDAVEIDTANIESIASDDESYADVAESEVFLADVETSEYLAAEGSSDEALAQELAENANDQIINRISETEVTDATRPAPLNRAARRAKERKNKRPQELNDGRVPYRPVITNRAKQSQGEHVPAAEATPDEESDVSTASDDQNQYLDGIADVAAIEARQGIAPARTGELRDPSSEATSPSEDLDGSPVTNRREQRRLARSERQTAREIERTQAEESRTRQAALDALAILEDEAAISDLATMSATEREEARLRLEVARRAAEEARNNDKITKQDIARVDAELRAAEKDDARTAKDARRAREEEARKAAADRRAAERLEAANLKLAAKQAAEAARLEAKAEAKAEADRKKAFSRETAAAAKEAKARRKTERAEARRRRRSSDVESVEGATPVEVKAPNLLDRLLRRKPKPEIEQTDAELAITSSEIIEQFAQTEPIASETETAGGEPAADEAGEPVAVEPAVEPTTDAPVVPALDEAELSPAEERSTASSGADVWPRPEESQRYLDVEAPIDPTAPTEPFTESTSEADDTASQDDSSRVETLDLEVVLPESESIDDLVSKTAVTVDGRVLASNDQLGMAGLAQLLGILPGETATRMQSWLAEMPEETRAKLTADDLVRAIHLLEENDASDSADANEAMYELLAEVTIRPLTGTLITYDSSAPEFVNEEATPATVEGAEAAEAAEEVRGRTAGARRRSSARLERRKAREERRKAKEAKKLERAEIAKAQAENKRRARQELAEAKRAARQSERDAKAARKSGRTGGLTVEQAEMSRSELRRLAKIEKQAGKQRAKEIAESIGNTGVEEKAAPSWKLAKRVPQAVVDPALDESGSSSRLSRRRKAAPASEAENLNVIDKKKIKSIRKAEARAERLEKKTRARDEKAARKRAEIEDERLESEERQREKEEADRLGGSSSLIKARRREIGKIEKSERESERKELQLRAKIVAKDRKAEKRIEKEKAKEAKRLAFENKATEARNRAFEREAGRVGREGAVDASDIVTEVIPSGRYTWGLESGVVGSYTTNEQLDHTQYDLPEPLPRR